MNMSRSARYVTQQSMWEVPFTGPLTDRKIAKYMKEGRYGEDLRVKEHVKIKRKKVQRDKRKAREKLFEGLFV